MTSGPHPGRGLARGGAVSLYIDGKPIGEGRIDATVPMIYSSAETCDVGCDTATPVSEDYPSDNSRLSGSVLLSQNEPQVDGRPRGWPPFSERRMFRPLPARRS